MGLEPLPSPPKNWLLGHAVYFRDGFLAGLTRLVETTGRDGLLSLDVGGSSRVFFYSAKHAAEVFDEERFEKKTSAGRGLLTVLGENFRPNNFTADTADPAWSKSHRILMPAFGPMGVRGMLPAMLDTADQLMRLWEASGPDVVRDIGNAHAPHIRHNLASGVRRALQCVAAR